MIDEIQKCCGTIFCVGKINYYQCDATLKLLRYRGNSLCTHCGRIIEAHVENKVQVKKITQVLLRGQWFELRDKEKMTP